MVSRLRESVAVDESSGRQLQMTSTGGVWHDSLGEEPRAKSPLAFALQLVPLAG